MISQPLGTTVIKSFWYTDFADNTEKSGFFKKFFRETCTEPVEVFVTPLQEAVL